VSQQDPISSPGPMVDEPGPSLSPDSVSSRASKGAIAGGVGTESSQAARGEYELRDVVEPGLAKALALAAEAQRWDRGGLVDTPHEQRPPIAASIASLHPEVEAAAVKARADVVIAGPPDHDIAVVGAEWHIRNGVVEHKVGARA
jgi:hypothetical protein